MCWCQTFLRNVVILEVRLNRLVLLVELCEVGNQVLDDVHCKARLKESGKK